MHGSKYFIVLHENGGAQDRGESDACMDITGMLVLFSSQCFAQAVWLGNSCGLLLAYGYYKVNHKRIPVVDSSVAKEIILVW